MSAKRKQWALFCALVAILACCLLVFILSRPPSSLNSERPARPTTTTKTETPQPPVIHSGPPRQRPSDEVRSCFGVLVWPGMAARALNYSRTILSSMEEWRFECGFVKTQATAGKDASSPLPADVTDSVWDLTEVSKNLNSIVLAEGDLPPAEVAAVREYLLFGGWAIMPTPEGGRISAEVEELIQLKPSRAATLMAPESPQSIGPLGAEEVRLLVPHSLGPGLAEHQWLEWAGPPGKVLYARRDEALPLLCFRRPELPAVRLVPFADGGVVHWKFPLRPGALIEDTELKAFLGDTLTWLLARANWVKPEQKEEFLKGIVREKEGSAIPGAKVTAQVYSDWGQPVQSFEVSSSEGGEFAFPVVEPAIHWVKAEAEGYYQVDMHLLARPVHGDAPQVEVVMEPQASIYGHAYYGPGEDHPAGGIPVTLAPNCRISSAWGRETVADKNGWFSFDKLPSAQTFYLIARREGWLGMQEAALPLEGGNLELDIHLQTPFAVEGTTANAATGEPLAGVEVEARPWPTEGSRFLFADALTQTTTSGQEGKFTLMLPPGRWRVFGRADSFSRPPLGHSNAFSVEVPERGQTDPSQIMVELYPHAALHGTVFASAGHVAPRAKVSAGPGHLVFWTDRHGQYRTDPIAPKFLGARPYFAVTAECQGEEGSASVDMLLPGQGPEVGPRKSYAELTRGNRAIDVDLRPRRPIEAESKDVMIGGSVFSKTGEPAPFVIVELAKPAVFTRESAYFAAGCRERTVSDSEGKFEFLGVGKGLWLIRARKKIAHGDGKTMLLWGEQWQPVEDEPIAPMKMVLGKAHVHGRIVRADGSPVRNNHVRFYLISSACWRQQSDIFLKEDGGVDVFPSGVAASSAVLTAPPSASYHRWAIEKAGGAAAMPWERPDVPPEGYVTLSMRTQGITFDIGHVALGEESLTVTFPHRQVRGYAYDADSGRPIPDAVVEAFRNDQVLASTRTNDEGAFSLSELPAGGCILRAYCRGYMPRYADVETMQEGERHIDLQMWTYWRIRGRLLLQETGEPLRVRIDTKDGVYLSARDGSFVISTPPVLERLATVPPGVITDLWFYYGFNVPLEGTGLKPITKHLIHFDPWRREVDLGDIYVEGQQAEGDLDDEGVSQVSF